MSTYHQVFVATGEPVKTLLADLAVVAGKELGPVDDGPVDFAVGVGSGAIEVELAHAFVNDGALRFEEYPLVVTSRDYDRDMERQEKWARRVYARLAATGRYALLLVLDVQHLLAADPPLPPPPLRVNDRLRCCVCGGDTTGAEDYVQLTLSTEHTATRQAFGAHAGHLEDLLAPGFTVELPEGGPVRHVPHR
jgi:hypothetical protein